MLTPIIAPTTSNMMAPETVRVRLKLPESALEDLAGEVAEASGLVARYLRFRPEFGTWQETFSGVASDRIDLGARPVWAVGSVTYYDGTVLAADVYGLDRGPFGESSILRLSGTSYSTSVPWSSWASFQSMLPPPVPDWTVQYTAGWWLEEMGPTPPTGVETFPRELQRDFLQIVRWLRATNSHIPGVRRMRDDGAEVEFFAAGGQDVDPLTGIPNRCLLSLSLYRRAA